MHVVECKQGVEDLRFNTKGSEFRLYENVSNETVSATLFIRDVPKPLSSLGDFVGLSTFTIQEDGVEFQDRVLLSNSFHVLIISEFYPVNLRRRAP